MGNLTFTKGTRDLSKADDVTQKILSMKMGVVNWE